MDKSPGGVQTLLVLISSLVGISYSFEQFLLLMLQCRGCRLGFRELASDLRHLRFVLASIIVRCLFVSLDLLLRFTDSLQELFFLALQGREAFSSLT